MFFGDFFENINKGFKRMSLFDEKEDVFKGMKNEGNFYC